ncbi:hypothetical protein ADUPG1_006183 [Aduncisulcus paluster]|uniref:Uncharacterized protein n=1 Tax=Aduncisulcus paluster TaxID=2918883 RepID=A0ABQ5KH61_9EUKA|nr:hypothetical protein ADUPG1_006183 [Aduncisulcus paluster]|eukprot:gnl/Carplike_NY0171/10954_a15552_135.p1 GENE.gnl/Carplike_NY0171/10954_a15552_135~~gnl/Carplike_NY0171/10954_a15552_135.p1  ORF type:complete len:327 (+),score=99.72 gnl/Carplike_NY0171/10954_a15552_135:146-982(+)
MQLKMDFAVSGEKDKVADTVSNLDTTVSDTIQAVCGTQVYYYAQMFDIMLPRVCYPLGHVQRQRIVDESAEKEGTIEVILRYVEIGPDGKEKNDIGADMKVDDEEEKPTLFEGEKEKEGEEEGEKGTKDSIEKEEEAENEYEYYDEEEDSVHEDDIVRDDITKKLPISFSIGRVRILCKKLLRIYSREIFLSYFDPKRNVGENLTNDQAILADLGFESGFVVKVSLRKAVSLFDWFESDKVLSQQLRKTNLLLNATRVDRELAREAAIKAASQFKVGK